MVFKRKQYGKRRFTPYKRRRFSFGRGRRSSLPFKNRKAIRKINSKIETKCLDTSSSGVSINSTGHAILFADLIAPGTGLTQRIGAKVHISSISFMVHWVIPNNVINDTYNYMRLVVLCVKNPTTPGTAPNWNALFTPVASDPTVNVSALPSWENRKRFRILYDKRVLLAHASQYSSVLYFDPAIPHVRVTNKLKLRVNKNIEYTGAYASINQLMFYLISDSTAPNHPLASIMYRIRFQDM